MKKPSPSSPNALRRWTGVLSAVLAAGIVIACGGGGGGSGATAGSALSAGPITGFGSVIVNGVRFNDDNASVTDDDGADLRGKLKLGMFATVKGSQDDGISGTASSVVVGGELQGPIEGTPDLGAKTFVVLGQTVEVTGSTIFDASLTNGFASLTTATVVEVHGVLNPASNRLQATFIEKKTNPSSFKIQGLVKTLNAGSKTFSIGGIRINYSSTQDVRVTLANDVLVRVRLQPQTPAPSEWVATRIRAPESNTEDRDEAEVEGTITSFTNTATFSVNGIAVDASGASFPKGSTGIAVGTRVEVKGSIRSSVLVATRVKLEDDNDVNKMEFELHGTVSGLTATSFVVRGVTVNFTPGVIVGSPASLINGARVEVKGQAADSSGSSTTITAVSIKFES
ncbi:MAG: hypothetical protein CVU30_04950 [Betaproteobacteria bacterium HGW-Betaproteobacteria-3]|jgi:hypothetical protein|nr:MAG: hypothetical protein CVU30_04950 [Betaproteobacteria bacterium HGW-Betaproteobacteria-3]